MMGSRKFFVLSAALVLALIGSDAALGQDFCTVTAGGTRVRAEGITERASEISMNCFGGTGTDPHTNYEVTVDVNGGVEITNTITDTNDDGDKILDGVRLRLLDEAAAEPVLTSHIADTLTDATGGDTAGQVRGVLDTPTSVRFLFDRPATTGRLRLRISGLRVDASAAGADVPITATMGVSGSPLISGDMVTLARPKTGLTDVKKIGNVVNGVSCANGANQVFKLNVAEGFATAFNDDVNAIVGGTNEEMRLKLSFDDIPSGVTVKLRPGTTTAGSDLDCGDGNGDDSLVLNLLAGLDSDGFGQGNTVSAADVENEDNPLWPVRLVNGSGVAFYEVNGSDPDKAENCEIPIRFDWKSNNNPSLGEGRVAVSFARTSTDTSADVEDVVMPRFKDTSKWVTAINIEDCSTTLLFPFVTNMADYDTGIAISNTSEDAFGTDAHGGTCTIHYHGMMMDGGAAPLAQTSDSIDGGEQLIFRLSSGNKEAGIGPAPGFQGYLMARCAFQFAHGLAFITNGAAGTPTLAQSYLALVVPVRYDNRTTEANGHESLNH